MPRILVAVVSSVLIGAAMMGGCTPEQRVYSDVGGAGGESSSSNSTSGSGGSGGVVVFSEDCLDGIDNDQDGAVDCADTDCAPDFTCLEAPPNGWSSVTVERGLGIPPALEPCDDGSMPTIYYTDPAGAPECSGCSCGPLMGTVCDDPKMTCYAGSSNCGGLAQEWTNSIPNGACVKPSNLLGGATALSCRITDVPKPINSGSCVPSVVDFPNKNTWSGWVKSCGAQSSSGGCVPGSTCRAKPPANQSACIRQAGQHVCPAGWAQTIEAYEGAVDDRACSECICAPSPNCPTSYRFFDFDLCDPGPMIAPIDVQGSVCTAITPALDNQSWSVLRIPVVTPGVCMAAGGEPSGQVTPTGAMTFCCK